MSLWTKISNWNTSRDKTNAVTILGKKAIVTTEINNLKGTGTILLDGMEWTARTKDDSVVAKDTVVTITAIEGVKVIVESVQKEEE